MKRLKKFESYETTEDNKVDVNLPFEELESEISHRIGLNFKVDIKESRDDKYFHFGSSKNYVDDCGPFKAALKDVTIGTFNGQYVNREGNIYYWMTWDIFYESKKAGSNGVTFLTAWYYPSTKKWEFE